MLLPESSLGAHGTVRGLPKPSQLPASSTAWFWCLQASSTWLPELGPAAIFLTLIAPSAIMIQGRVKPTERALEEQAGGLWSGPLSGLAISNLGGDARASVLSGASNRSWGPWQWAREISVKLLLEKQDRPATMSLREGQAWGLGMWPCSRETQPDYQVSQCGLSGQGSCCSSLLGVAQLWAWIGTDLSGVG